MGIKIKILIFQCAVLLYCLTISSFMERKFDWSGTVTSPQEYPVEIYDGQLIAEDGSFSFSSIWGTTNKGWGNRGKAMSGKLLNLPKKLSFTWYSIVEKKFYKGTWVLPYNDIVSLFTEGYTYNNEKKTFNGFIIGLAPKGMVVVWVAGLQQIEIGRYQAEEISIDPTKEKIDPNDAYIFRDGFAESVLNDKQIMKPEIKAKITKLGYPSHQLYDSFRERFNWHPLIELPSDAKILSVLIKMCNGEIAFYENGIIDQNKKRAIPYSFEIIWEDKLEHNFICRIAFTKEKDYWDNYVATGQTTVPIDFELSEIRSLFGQHVKNNDFVLRIRVEEINKTKDDWKQEVQLQLANNQITINEIIYDIGKY
jgi:Protein of unknown function (DUF2931)